MLSEIKKITAWVDLHRTITKWSLALIVPLVLLGFAVLAYEGSQIQETAKTNVESPNWYEVRVASRSGDLKKALDIADDLLELNPMDFEAHYRKGEILIMLGDKGKALECFKRAEEIFPIPKYRDAVKALENQTPAEKGGTHQPATRPGTRVDREGGRVIANPSPAPR